MNTDKLPKEWIKTKLGTLIELKYGKSLAAHSRDGIGFDVFGSNGIVGKHSKALVNNAGLIIGRKGSFGVVNKSSSPFFPIDTTYYVDEFYKQSINFWFYYLTFLPLTKLNRSTAIPGLNRDDAYALDITLPSLAEQKIIADKLDDLLARVESIKTRLEIIPDILKKFRTSVLNSAVSYVDENKPSSKKKLSEICRFQNGYAFKSDFFSKDGIHQVIKLANIRDGYLFLENSPSYISPEVFNEFKRYVPDEGDILISMTGTRFKKDYGFACVITESHNSFLINQRVGRITPLKDIVSPKFLYLFIRSDLFRREFFKGETGGVNQGNVGSKHIMSIEINLPTLDEQEKIAHQLDNIFSYANALEKKITSSLLKVNNLTQSILAKAFRGELTAQWREENLELISGVNSAEALLQKISTEKLASGVTKKRVKKLAC
ncbi:TPA: restriction endonuclease subunit S [Raoultella ornithinolytica]|nr:restriction endonuclease subunit S [Raoultella ornithinolytica]